MPLYEYACAKCGEITEVIQKISDGPPSTCPHCGGRKMEKVMSRSSFQLKGGGWYSEGYSSTSGKKGESNKAEGKSEAKADPAPAAKADAATSPAPKAEAKPKSEAKAAPKASKASKKD